MSTSSTISPASSQQSPGSARLPSMILSTLDTKSTESKSPAKWPDSVDIRINTKNSNTGKYVIRYMDARTGKWTDLERGQTVLSRAQIGNKQAYPTLYIMDVLSRKRMMVPGNATREGAYGSNVKLDIRTNGSRVITLKGNPRQGAEQVTISLLPKFSSETKKPSPSSTPKQINGNNRDDGTKNDVFNVTYKKDGKGNVIIEGQARRESLLVYDETAKRWLHLKEGTKDDLDKKNNGLIRFRIVVKEGHTIGLHSVNKDSNGYTVAGNRVATLYTTKNPKRDKSDGAVILAAAAGGIAAAGAGAKAGAMSIAKSGAATIGGAVAASNVRNPPKSRPKPETPTKLEAIMAAMRPVQTALTNTDLFKRLSRSITNSPPVRNALSDRNGVDVDAAGRPTAAEAAQMQAAVVTFSKTAGPVLLQLLLSAIASGALAGLSSLIKGIAGGKILNNGNPAMISIFGYNPLTEGKRVPYSGAAGLGPYLGVTPTNSTVSNTNFNVSFATPTKVRIGGRDYGLGITLTWAIDTKEKNDYGSVGDRPSFVIGGFGYVLEGRSTPPLLDPPTDQKKTERNFTSETRMISAYRFATGPDANMQIGSFWLAGLTIC